MAWEQGIYLFRIDQTSDKKIFKPDAFNQQCSESRTITGTPYPCNVILCMTMFYLPGAEHSVIYSRFCEASSVCDAKSSLLCACGFCLYKLGLESERAARNDASTECKYE